MAISPSMMASLPYDPVKSFAPITQLTSSPLTLIVRPDLPVKSVKEFLDYAKANPGKLNLGSIGLGSTTHLAAELLRSMTGIEYVHVPYKGSAPVINDMLGGQVEFSFLNIGGALPYIQSGRLRAVAMTGAKRSANMPDLPAIAETVPGYEASAWYGMAAPAGTPKPIVDRLHDEFVRILRTPEITKRLAEMSYDVEGTTPEQHAQKIKDDIARWAAVIKAAGIKPQ
jgi:tripartite-type tricarboxylate transporter receptor subunit TctC